MRVEEKDLRGGTLLFDHYLYQYHRLQNFFGYHPFLLSSINDRLQWLKEHSFTHRQALVQGLLDYNRKMGNHPNAIKNIELLSNDDSYVVVGGQQAGILTGPLYVIHKAITLIQLADQLQKKTDKNIVPVFWIASEDHDWDEVDHNFVFGWDHEIKKVKMQYPKNDKVSVNEIELDPNIFIQYIDEMFRWLPDSVHHQELKTNLLELASTSTKLNDFFARIMCWLFGESGLILIDSADGFVRELEKPIFSRLMTEDLNPALIETRDQLISSGYHSQLDIQRETAHFFLHHNEERKLMVREGDQLRAKDGTVSFSVEELKSVLDQEPGYFSSNVVSRPIMQETILPVFAFVGGPGEIAYWAQLKPVFTHFGLQMPIVYPRMSFTLIDRKTEKFMKEYELSFEDALNVWEEKRQAWLNAQLNVNMEEEFKQLQKELSKVYQSFLSKLTTVEPGAKNLGESTGERLIGLLQFLEKRTTSAISQRHDAVLRHWETIRTTMKPLEKPQERVYNVFGYLNEYGTDWLKALIRLPYSMDGTHKTIYI